MHQDKTTYFEWPLAIHLTVWSDVQPDMPEKWSLDSASDGIFKFVRFNNVHLIEVIRVLAKTPGIKSFEFSISGDFVTVTKGIIEK